MKEIRPIRSEADYDAALKAIAVYFEREPKPGSRSRASEILNRRRYLTLEMAWALTKQWGIPAASLIRPYKLREATRRRRRAA